MEINLADAEQREVKRSLKSVIINEEEEKMKSKWIWNLLICMLVLIWPSGAALADDAYAETPLENATAAQRHNILLAAQAIDGIRIDFGGEFSFNGIVGERSAERGYQNAENGRGVEVTGGGVAQTATTLYLALMQRDDIEYSSIYTYNERFSGSYVDSGYDAIATDYNNGLDFAFDSYHEGTLAIYMWVDEDSLCCYVTEEAGTAPENGELIGCSRLPADADGAQLTNIALAAKRISGWRLRPGDTFSFNGIVGPRSIQEGYQSAPNGRGVDVVGGGVAQAASAVYMAVRDLEAVEIVEKQAYGNAYAGTYVDNGEDAVLVDYNGNIDFSFVYRGDAEMGIYIYMDREFLVCDIYEE